MKRPFFVLWFLTATLALHAEEPRTFTATDGRPLKAVIVSKTETHVTIRRAEDGQEFLLPLERLSAADQEFVKAWGATVVTVPAVQVTKTWILEPKWEGAGMFGDGLAPVKLGGKWGFIDETGKMVITPAWDEALSFADGLAPVRKEGKWGYIDKTGKLVIEPNWEDASGFSSGTACVTKKGLFGYIDTTGKVISEPQWQSWEPFVHGVAPVRKGNRIGVLDRGGRMLAEQESGDAGMDWNNLTRNAISEHGFCITQGAGSFRNLEKSSGSARFFDLTGKLIFQQPVAVPIQFHEGLAAAWVADNQLTFIDKSGTSVIKPIFIAPQYKGTAQSETPHYRFSDGLAAVPGRDAAKEHKLRYIDKTGKVVIPARFRQAGPFSEGVALVSESERTQDAKWSIIDKTGNVLAPVQLPPGGSLIFYGRKILAFQHGLVPFQIRDRLTRSDAWNNAIGYLDRTGKVAIPPSFRRAEPFEGGVAWVEPSTLRTTNIYGDMAFIAPSGSALIPLTRGQSSRLSWKYHDPDVASPIPSAGSARRYGLVDHTGKITVPPTWEDAEILSASLIAIRSGGKLGFVNATGAVVLLPEIENIQEVEYQDEHYVVARQAYQWGLLEIKTGRFTPQNMPNGRRKVTAMPDDFAAYQENERWGVKAKAGSILVPPQYVGMTQVSKERFWVTKDGNDTLQKWALMSQAGEMLTDFEWGPRPYYSPAFSEGLLLVVKDRPGNKAEGGMSGYMDESGKLVIPLTPGRKSDFAHGAAMVWNGNESGLINPKGEWIFKSTAEVELSEIGFTSSFTDFFEHGLALVETPLKWGFVKLGKDTQ
jgi:hypothetical protein